MSWVNDRPRIGGFLVVLAIGASALLVPARAIHEDDPGAPTLLVQGSDPLRAASGLVEISWTNGHLRVSRPLGDIPVCQIGDRSWTCEPPGDTIDLGRVGEDPCLASESTAHLVVDGAVLSLRREDSQLVVERTGTWAPLAAGRPIRIGSLRTVEVALPAIGLLGDHLELTPSDKVVMIDAVGPTFPVVPPRDLAAACPVIDTCLSGEPTACSPDTLLGLRLRPSRWGIAPPAGEPAETVRAWNTDGKGPTAALLPRTHTMLFLAQASPFAAAGSPTAEQRIADAKHGVAAVAGPADDATPILVRWGTNGALVRALEPAAAYGWRLAHELARVPDGGALRIASTGAILSTYVPRRSEPVRTEDALRVLLDHEAVVLDPGAPSCQLLVDPTKLSDLRPAEEDTLSRSQALGDGLALAMRLCKAFDRAGGWALVPAEDTTRTLRGLLDTAIIQGDLAANVSPRVGTDPPPGGGRVPPGLVRGASAPGRGALRRVAQDGGVAAIWFVDHARRLSVDDLCADGETEGTTIVRDTPANSPPSGEPSLVFTQGHWQYAAAGGPEERVPDGWRLPCPGGTGTIEVRERLDILARLRSVDGRSEWYFPFGEGLVALTGGLEDGLGFRAEEEGVEWTLRGDLQLVVEAVARQALARAGQGRSPSAPATRVAVAVLRPGKTPQSPLEILAATALPAYDPMVKGDFFAAQSRPGNPARNGLLLPSNRAAPGSVFKMVAAAIVAELAYPGGRGTAPPSYLADPGFELRPMESVDAAGRSVFAVQLASFNLRAARPRTAPRAECAQSAGPGAGSHTGGMAHAMATSCNVYFVRALLEGLGWRPLTGENLPTYGGSTGDPAALIILAEQLRRFGLVNTARDTATEADEARRTGSVPGTTLRIAARNRSVDVPLMASGEVDPNIDPNILAGLAYGQDHLRMAPLWMPSLLQAALTGTAATPPTLTPAAGTADAPAPPPPEDPRVRLIQESLAGVIDDPEGTARSLQGLLPIGTRAWGKTGTLRTREPRAGEAADYDNYFVGEVCRAEGRNAPVRPGSQGCIVVLVGVQGVGEAQKPRAGATATTAALLREMRTLDGLWPAVDTVAGSP